jgi:hypothetical protein
VGYDALYNSTGYDNTAIGYLALGNNTTGFRNVALGDAAGISVTTGSYNIYIGNPGPGVDESGTTRIGNPIEQNATYIAGIAGQTVGMGSTTCYVDGNGKLGVFLSARRYKQNIQRMDDASAALYSLKPVTFSYKPQFDPSGTAQFGLVAEEVAAVNSDLVVRDLKGEISTVRYEAINVMLLNEFLKEHRKVETLEATVADLATQLREIRAQVQMNNSTAGIIADHQ